jgi:hypothetical protein
MLIRLRIQFMMDFELKLTKPHRSGALIEGLVMGVSYLLGIDHSSTLNPDELRY